MALFSWGGWVHGEDRQLTIACFGGRGGQSLIYTHVLRIHIYIYLSPYKITSQRNQPLPSSRLAVKTGALCPTMNAVEGTRYSCSVSTIGLSSPCSLRRGTESQGAGLVASQSQPKVLCHEQQLHELRSPGNPGTCMYPVSCPQRKMGNFEDYMYYMPRKLSYPLKMNVLAAANAISYLLFRISIFGSRCPPFSPSPKPSLCTNWLLSIIQIVKNETTYVLFQKKCKERCQPELPQ